VKSRIARADTLSARSRLAPSTRILGRSAFPVNELPVTATFANETVPPAGGTAEITPFLPITPNDGGHTNV